MIIDDESLQELFTTTDPEGLIAAGAPADEYEPEMEQLTATLAVIPSGETSRTKILDTLDDIWRRDFAATEERLAHCRPAFESIADQLLEHYD